MSTETPDKPKSYEELEVEIKNRIKVLTGSDDVEGLATQIASSTLSENSSASLAKIKEIRNLMVQALLLLGKERSEKGDALQRELSGVSIFLDGVRFGKKIVIKHLQSELDTE